nr:MAG TPA: hypothetical protein [Microviridae sp.]
MCNPVIFAKRATRSLITSHLPPCPTLRKMTVFKISAYVS